MMKILFFEKFDHPHFLVGIIYRSSKSEKDEFPTSISLQQPQGKLCLSMTNRLWESIMGPRTGVDVASGGFERVPAFF